MKAKPTPENAEPAAKKRSARHAPREKLSIREYERQEGKWKWTEYIAQGWREADGKYGRKKFRSFDDADAFIKVKRVELINNETVLHNVTTRLSVEQVQEAEGAFNRLAERYTLAEAVEYFIRNFARPDKPVPLDVARDAFLCDPHRAKKVKERTFIQLRSTLRRFIGFATLHLLPAELKPEIERVRAEICEERAAKPAEVVRRLDPALREAGRKAFEDVEDVKTLLSRRLDPVLREAVATARDAIEAKRKPKDGDLAAALVASVEGAKVPAVHEISKADVEAYLHGLRAKDGSAAELKTWNNVRADLHALFRWCAQPERRWCAENPVSTVEKFDIGRGDPQVLILSRARDLMAYVADYKGGAMVPYFALALFAGVRTDPRGEMVKLARHPLLKTKPLIDLKHGVIHILPEISKTNDYRKIKIRHVVHQWLTHFEGDIWPTNADRMVKHIRGRFRLEHDVLRHSFFSYLVAAEKSIENAALEGGNTEKIVKKHYLDLANIDEGEEFWKIAPPEDEESKVVDTVA